MTTQQREQIIDWKWDVMFIRRAHYASAKRLEDRTYWLGIPVVILTAIVGTSIFSTLGSTPDLRIQIAVGIMSILATILSSLQTFLRYSERAEKHRDAGAKFGTLNREIDQFLSSPELSDAEVDRWMTSIRKRWDRYARDSPTADRRSWDQARDRTSQERKSTRE